MALLGNAAMLLFYDIVPDQRDAHDEWHTREHFPERLAIPGFRRAHRWVADASAPRYLVIYDVDDVEVLSGEPYLARLNNPTAWTRRMMRNFRGMARGFCNVVGRRGDVLGATMAAVRFGPKDGQASALEHWIGDALMPGLVQRSGVAGAVLLQSVRAPAMTDEQRIRGTDARLDWVLLVSGYHPETIAGIATRELTAGRLQDNGAGPNLDIGCYRLACIADARGDRE